MIAERVTVTSPDLRLIRGGKSALELVPAVDLGCRVVFAPEDAVRGAAVVLSDRSFLVHSAEAVSGEIFSSTGNLGREIRPFNRVYENRQEYSADSFRFLSDFREMTHMIDGEEQVTRAIMRGLVSESVLREVLESSEGVNLEVALRVSEFTGDDSWLIYLAKNSQARSSIVPVDEMILATERDKSVPTEAPERRIQKVLDQGYRFVNSFTKEQVGQVLDLWRDTFGWSFEEVHNLRRRLHEGDEGLWFSAVVDSSGNILTAATAEKLDIPAREGVLSIVENTEWRTKDGYQGRGLMTATLDMLNAQVLYDLRPTDSDRLPIIYAECNFQSRSDRAGHGAGFTIPQRTIDGYMIPQVIAQNVNIGDNQPVPSDKLRDFTFMYLSADTIGAHYGSWQVDKMLSSLTI